MASSTAPASAGASSFLATWDTQAELTPRQQASLRQIALQSEKTNAGAGAGTSAKHGAQQAGEQLCLETMEDFLRWFSKTDESVDASLQTRAARQYLDKLDRYADSCGGLLDAVDDSLQHFDSLLHEYEQVRSKAGTLHEACRSLLADQVRLQQAGKELERNLQYFTELDTLHAQLSRSSLSATNEEFIPLLNRLDECITFCAEHPHYREARRYLTRFKMLQVRSLGLIKAHTVTQLRMTAQTVWTQRQHESSTDSLETSLLYMKFRMIAPSIKTLMQELERRAHQADTKRLLADCQACYFQQRLTLLRPSVRSKIDALNATGDEVSMAEMTRQMCLYLMRVCELEHQFYHHFFTEADQGLADMLESLCSVLFEDLRPRIIQQHSLDLLCDVAGVVKAEVLGSALETKGEAAAAFAPVAQRLLADTQERLIFRVQVYVRDEVRGYTPHAEAVKYPGVLLDAQQQQAEGGDDAAMSPAAQYPPLMATLHLLAQLYRALDARTFAGLAQDAVEACLAVLLAGAKRVQRTASELDARLFLIRHLLILRDELTEFDVDFGRTEKDLDFTHLRQTLVDIVMRRSSLAMLTDVRLAESRQDSRKTIDRELKHACEAFILTATQMSLAPLLALLTKINAFLSTGNGAQLRAQAFAQPDAVAAALSSVLVLMRERLAALLVVMKLYVPQAYYQAILVTPVRNNVNEAVTQLASLLRTHYTDADVASITLASCSTDAVLDLLQAVVADPSAYAGTPAAASALLQQQTAAATMQSSLPSLQAPGDDRAAAGAGDAGADAPAGGSAGDAGHAGHAGDAGDAGDAGSAGSAAGSARDAPAGDADNADNADNAGDNAGDAGTTGDADNPDDIAGDAAPGTDQAGPLDVDAVATAASDSARATAIESIAVDPAPAATVAGADHIRAMPVPAADDDAGDDDIEEIE